MILPAIFITIFGFVTWNVNTFNASVIFDGISLFIGVASGLHFMANYMQGTLLGLGVSGNKESSILQPIFKNVIVWLSGGEFGIEASFFGVMVLIGITIYVYKNIRIGAINIKPK